MLAPIIRADLNQRVTAIRLLLVAAVIMMSAGFAQSPITPLDALVANHGSISAGPVTFSSFQKPGILPNPLTPVNEFGDIGVSAVVNTNGTVSLVFFAIDPATGSPSPLTTSPTGAADLIRFITYSITVNDPSLRLHSVDQSFGPGTVVTGNNSAINGLYTSEPVPNVYDLLVFDQIDTGGASLLRGANMPSADGSGSFSGAGGILLPGGNLVGYTMGNEFGLIKGHWNFPPGGTLDSVIVTFGLVPAGTTVPAMSVSLAQNGFIVDASGLGSITLSTFAQERGAVVTLSSSNPAAVSMPATVTVGQGYRLSSPFLVASSAVDAPTPVILSASFNSDIQSVPFTAIPPTPLAVVGLTADFLPPNTAVPPNTIRLLINMSRTNTSPETVLLTSSKPTVAPVPASFTIPALTAPGDFRFTSFTTTYSPVGEDTPVTFSALFNGAAVSTTVTIPKTVDTVSIGRAELTVRNLQLKVDATSNTPGAVLRLYNAATGQLLGVMIDNGPGSGVEKYSFQGAVSPVTTVLVKSSFNGAATAAVVQK
jgi:hypothetical protein